MISVLLIAHDPLVRAGLTSLLATESIHVFDEVDSPHALNEDDLELLDCIIWRSNDADDSEALSAIDLPILALLETEEVRTLPENVRAFLSIYTDSDALVAAIQAVCQGFYVIDEMFETLVNKTQVDTELLFDDLTARELEVLNLLCEGLSNKAIAKTLSISDNTVKFHVNQLLSKFGVSSRTELVIRAIQGGLVTV